jgi:serine/threonine protein kinase/tetratricopeptide (TPR) repeat protein
MWQQRGAKRVMERSLMQTTLSHYRILEQIGAGGMGVVYRAHDDRLDRDVALKVLSPGTGVEIAARKRFHKEALTLSKLNHPNIATVHDFDTQDGTDFLVEEFIEGLSLDAMLVSGPLSEKEIIDLGSQLAEGLAAAHEHGVIHRDLKPANVRVTPDARLKILDFGLAIMLRREADPTAVTESLSESKATAGTMPYMAPEQLLGSKLDARTDIWAAGCVLYEMATGRRPFLSSGPTLTEAILHRPPPGVSKLNPEIRTALDRVIQKCLDKDAGKRYQSAREIAVDLRRAVSAPMSAGIRLRLTQRFAVLAVVVAIAAVIGIGIRRKSSLDRFSSGKDVTGVTGQAVPLESYLAGLQQFERWDKPSNLESAIGLFEQAIKADPGFALGFSALGEAYWAKYRLSHDSRWIDEAERNCRRAAELNSRLPAVYVTLARVHNGKEQYNLALQEIQQALKLEPRDPDALLSEAAVYAGMGRQDYAESTYEKAAALRPQHWGGYYELGVFYYRQQRYADAAVAFERVLEITPDNAMAHATLGGMMQLLGKDVEAEKHLVRSIELQPSYAAYTNLGALYYRERRWEESVAMTRKALEINAADWRAWSNLRLAYEWLNRKGEAEEAFRNELARLEEIAKISADDAEVQAELGLLYSKLKLRETLPRIEAALALSPEDSSVLVRASEVYENLGDRARALELVNHALAKGWTLADLQNDPGQQNLLRDPRFRRTARQLKNKTSPAQQRP